MNSLIKKRSIMGLRYNGNIYIITNISSQKELNLVENRNQLLIKVPLDKHILANENNN